MEIRLVYVIDRSNGMPVYFQYSPGNIVNVSTLCTTMAELSQYGISIDYTIVDASYFSEDNVKELYKNCIKTKSTLLRGLPLTAKFTNRQQPVDWRHPFVKICHTL